MWNNCSSRPIECQVSIREISGPWCFGILGSFKVLGSAVCRALLLLIPICYSGQIVLTNYCLFGMRILFWQLLLAGPSWAHYSLQAHRHQEALPETQNFATPSYQTLTCLYLLFFYHLLKYFWIFHKNIHLFYLLLQIFCLITNCVYFMFHPKTV